MEKKTSLKVIKSSDSVTLYSICFEEDAKSEFDKFVDKFKDNATYSEMFSTIVYALNHILHNGAKERYFRPEGGDVKALGLDSKKLRLYCLLVSEQIVILGNGGVKNTRTYQEDEKLNGYVLDLKQFNKLLKMAQKSGKVTIEGNVIRSVEFEIINF